MRHWEAPEALPVPGTRLDAGDTVRPLVRMERTSFRTYTLRLAGTTQCAVRIVAAAPTYQRVVVSVPNGAATVFVTDVPTELEIRTLGGAISPGGTYAVIGSVPQVLVLAPNQPLMAAATVANTPFSVSASEEIPMPPGVPGYVYGETFFRTFTVPQIGAPAARIAPTARVPRRVQIQAQNTGIAVSAVPDGVQGPSATPIPGGAYFLGLGLTGEFVLAPQQPLYAARDVGPGTLSLSVSEIHLPAYRGPTGIPGPDSEE